MLYLNNQGKLVSHIGDGSDNINLFSDFTVTEDAWNYVALVYRDDTSLTLYINGKNGGGTISGTIGNIDDVANAGIMAIGAENDLGVPFEGQIDEVKIFNYALTPQQLKTDMNAGAVKFQ